MKVRKRIKTDLDFRTAIKRLIGVAVAVFVIVLIAVVQYIYPFRNFLPAYALPERGEGEMRFHFLDVGQGDCTIVEFSDGTVVVVDSGVSAWATENRLTRYLKALKPCALSLVVTHADSDHYGNMAALLESFTVDTLYLPTHAANTKEYAHLLSLAAKKGVPMSVLTRRMTLISSSDAYGVCLSPVGAEGEKDNEASAVIYFEYAGVGAVLSGDIGVMREEEIEKEYVFSEEFFDSGSYSVRLERTQIFKMAHHGAGDSSSQRWVSMLSPSVSVVSCGKGNDYGHPDSEALSRLKAVGSEIYRTDELGDVMVTVSKDGTLRVQTGYLK